VGRPASVESRSLDGSRNARDFFLPRAFPFFPCAVALADPTRLNISVTASSFSAFFSASFDGSGSSESARPLCARKLPWEPQEPAPQEGPGPERASPTPGVMESRPRLAESPAAAAAPRAQAIAARAALVPSRTAAHSPTPLHPAFSCVVVIL